MTEAAKQPPADPSVQESDPSVEVAETQAPAHLEERGLDVPLEDALDHSVDRGDES